MKQALLRLLATILGGSTCPECGTRMLPDALDRSEHCPGCDLELLYEDCDS